MARAAGKWVSEAVMHLIYRFSFSEVPTILFVISVYCLCSFVAGLFGFLSEKHFDLWGSCCSVFLGGVQEFHVLIDRFFDVPFTGAPDQRFERFRKVMTEQEFKCKMLIEKDCSIIIGES
jgi:hypothetical protein